MEKDNTVTTDTTNTIFKKEYVQQYGWICPVCGRGLSPWTSVCPCRGMMPFPYEITCKLP